MIELHLLKIFDSKKLDVFRPVKYMDILNYIEINMFMMSDIKKL